MGDRSGSNQADPRGKGRMRWAWDLFALKIYTFLSVPHYVVRLDIRHHHSAQTHNKSHDTEEDLGGLTYQSWYSGLCFWNVIGSILHGAMIEALFFPSPFFAEVSQHEDAHHWPSLQNLIVCHTLQGLLPASRSPLSFHRASLRPPASSEWRAGLQMKPAHDKGIPPPPVHSVEPERSLSAGLVLEDPPV